MNAPHDTREIPGCIAKREPEAAFAWFSNRRLLIVKGAVELSLSADDLKRLFNFVEACTIEEQL